MIIKLIKSSRDDVVHGTDNGKKTACNINLQRDARNFQEIGTSENILPLTCEKCRTVLAQKIINEDKKERKRLIKEEKIREKKGIVDENIISLAGRHARPIDETPEPEPEPQPIEQNQASPDSTATEAPATSPYMNSELAKFAIPVPPPAQEDEKPAEKIQKNDDFLAQFAVSKTDTYTDTYNENNEKPAPESYNKDEEDDFLSHFTMPESYNDLMQDNNNSDFTNDSYNSDDDFDFLDTPTVSAEEVYDESVSPDEEFSPAPITSDDSDDDFLAQFNIPKQPESTQPVADNSNSDDDFLAQFNIPKQPENIQPVADNSNSDDDFLSQFNIQKPQEDSFAPKVEETPYNIEENTIEDISVPELDEIPEIPDVPVLNEIEDISVPELDKIPEIPDVPVLNEIKDISVPEPDEIPEIPDVPVLNEIEDISVPELDEIPEIPDVPVLNEIEDISVPEPDEIPEIPDVPVLNEIEDISVPEPDEIPDIPENHTEKTPEITQPKQYESPKNNTSPFQNPPFPQFAANSQPQIMNIPQLMGYAPDGSPMYQYVPSQFIGYDTNSQPIFIPLQMPVNNIPPVNNPIPPMNNIQNNIPPVNNPIPPMNNTQNNIPPVNNPVPPMNNTQNNIPPVSNPIPPMNNIPPVMPKSNINISYLANESRNTPSAVANAIAQSTKKKNLNLFDMQENPEMPTIFDSPEAAFSQLSGEKFKKKEDKKDSISTKGLFEEYKAPSPSKKKSYGNSSSPSPKKAPAEPQRPLSKEELKAKKRQEKIDAKFKKDLAKRGF